jgi:Ca2+-binding EF-hand superfamily protein
MSEAVATPEARLASPSEVALVPTSLEEEGGLTPFLQGSDPMLDEAVRAEKARVRAEKKAQRRALNKRALVDPIISSKRLEVYGRWMSRKTAKFKVGFEGDPKSGTRRSAHGVVSLLEVAGGEQMFKLSFQGLYLTNPDDSPLYLYVTTRKARKTTGDVEQHCTRVEMDHRDDGCIGHEGTSGNIEQVLTGIDDPVQLRGLYIIKPARAKPETSEAVIFAFGNMEDFALEIPVSSEVLGVQAARDGIDQLKARIEAQRGRAAVQGGDQSLSLTTVRRQAQRAWRKFGKSPRLDSAKFEEFKDMLNYLDIIVLEPRAVKLFSECDLDHSKHIEIGELEIALLMNASLPPDTHLTPTDAFATFDLDGTGFIDELEFMEAIQVLGIDISTPKREKKVTYLFGKIDKLGSATVDQGQFLQLWAQLVNAPEELRGRGIPPAIGPKSKKRNVQKLLDALAQEQVDRDAAFHRVKMDAIKLKYDERKRQQEKARELMLETTAENREAKREQAKRDKAERIRRRKEQEEIIKREQREAQLKRKMEDAKLERERKVQEDFHNERVQKAEQELVERRKRREDRIELAQMGIRDLPASVYEGKTAQVSACAPACCLPTPLTLCPCEL